MEIEVRKCPQCRAPAAPSAEQCEYCHAEFFVKNLAYLEQFDFSGIEKYLKHYKGLVDQDSQNSEGVLGLGLCHLQMGTYPLAQKQFKQIIETSPEVAPAYYYYALANIAGRRLMTLSLSEVRQFEMYLNTAMILDSEVPQYRLLLAMLKRDYYETNGLKVPPPSAEELLSSLYGQTVDKDEIKHLMKSVRVSGQDDYFNELSIV